MRRQLTIQVAGRFCFYEDVQLYSEDDIKQTFDLTGNKNKKNARKNAINKKIIGEDKELKLKYEYFG